MIRSWRFFVGVFRLFQIQIGGKIQVELLQNMFGVWIGLADMRKSRLNFFRFFDGSSLKACDQKK